MADVNDLNHALATEMSVRTVNITFSAKRTIKVGDEYHGFEAMESWTLKHDGHDTIPPEAARKVALIHGPVLIKNVIMALHVGGVMPLAQAKETVERIKRIYGLLAGGTSDPAGDQSDLRGTGPADDQAGAGPGVGDRVPEDQVTGVPPEAEHGH